MAAFLRRARHWYARPGIRIERVLTDTGSASRSHVVAAACRALQVAQRWTRPYRPQTNGKAERVIHTLRREWASAQASATSVARQAALPAWLHQYTTGTARMADFTGLRPSAARLRRTIS